MRLLGERVAILSGGRIDASGQRGGGEVLVGGDYQGKNPDVQNAQRTHVAADTEIRADAVAEGDGGKVVIWADGDTRFPAHSARGAGQAATAASSRSRASRSSISAAPSTSARKAASAAGCCLDPQDILINATAQPSPPNNANGTPDVAFADPPAAGTYTIQVADVTGYSELYLQATRNITLASALAMTAGNSVRFEAGNTIAINAALTASGGVNLSGASVTSNAAGTITTTGAGSQNAGNVTINSTGLVNLAGTGHRERRHGGREQHRPQRRRHFHNRRSAASRRRESRRREATATAPVLPVARAARSRSITAGRGT